MTLLPKEPACLIVLSAFSFERIGKREIKIANANAPLKPKTAFISTPMAPSGMTDRFVASLLGLRLGSMVQVTWEMVSGLKM